MYGFMQQNPRILYFWKEIIDLCPQENNEPRRRKSFDLHLITPLALLCFEEKLRKWNIKRWLICLSLNILCVCTREMAHVKVMQWRAYNNIWNNAPNLLSKAEELEQKVEKVSVSVYGFLRKTKQNTSDVIADTFCI